MNGFPQPGVQARVERCDGLDVICHELRNSLAVVRGAARLLRVTPTNERASKAASLIERHVGQMGRHIEDLLQPRRSAGGRALQLSRIDLRAIARYAIDAVGPTMNGHRHRLQMHMPEEPVWIQGDGARLEQVISNLLLNAGKYTPDGGDVSLTVSCADDTAFLRVRDSGVGIEPCMLSRVFGLFVQVDGAAPRSEGGRGIGLAVVRDLVELHGGNVRADSAGLGLGSEFSVMLPALGRRTDSPVIVTP